MLACAAALYRMPLLLVQGGTPATRIRELPVRHKYRRPPSHQTAVKQLACISHSRWRIVGEMAQCAGGESRAVVDTKGEYRRGGRECGVGGVFFSRSSPVTGTPA